MAKKKMTHAQELASSKTSSRRRAQLRDYYTAQRIEALAGKKTPKTKGASVSGIYSKLVNNASLGRSRNTNVTKVKLNSPRALIKKTGEKTIYKGKVVEKRKKK